MCLCEEFQRKKGVGENTGPTRTDGMQHHQSHKANAQSTQKSPFCSDSSTGDFSVQAFDQSVALIQWRVLMAQNCENGFPE